MDTTDAIEAHAAGKPEAIAQVLPQVYRELRRLAHSYMARERLDHTLQPTALVHEAYVRLVDKARISWQGKTHFFAIAATEMRRVLIEHARSHGSKKRGGGFQKVSLHEGLVTADAVLVDVLDLDKALLQLDELSPRQARIAEFRFFAGMNVRETASAIGMSERTVKEEWRVAKAWLQREMSHTRGSPYESGSP